jgi:hypothetical protein
LYTRLPLGLNRFFVERRDAETRRKMTKKKIKSCKFNCSKSGDILLIVSKSLGVYISLEPNTTQKKINRRIKVCNN